MFIPEWLDGLRFAFSNRQHGQMSFSRERRSIVLANRKKFLESSSLNLTEVVAAELIHDAGVAHVSAEHAGRGARKNDWIEGVDGFVTTDRNVLLLTTHADCAPLIVFDEKHAILGQAHAGWRGLASGIVHNLVSTVQSQNGKSPGRLKAWIGPTVGPCCYPVGQEVVKHFPQECCYPIGNSIRFDIVSFIDFQLEQMGFQPEDVSHAGVCTGCSGEFSSYRRDGNEVNAMICVTGLPR